jgi:DNA mismatch repair protein MutS2
VLYPKNIGEKLGFDLVLAKLQEYCDTEQGRAVIRRVKFTDDEELLNLWLGQASEAKDIIEKGSLSLGLRLDFDLQEKAAKAHGFFYEVESISDIKSLLVILKQVLTYLVHNEAAYPMIAQLFAGVVPDFSLIETIDDVIDINNEIKPSASKNLQKIITNIAKTEKDILRNSTSLFAAAKEKGLLGDTELGIKNGRVVLPVLSEHKRKVTGLLIDQSGTGKISYIEPIELVALNNELAELHIKRRQEIIIILRQLTAKIVLQLTDIKLGKQRLATFDFIRAKARLASEWKCHKPTLDKETRVVSARHPLLADRLKAEHKEAVPLDYSLTKEQRIIVISGPNAGGKSVALKTVGLVQYMLQCGFLVPCSPISTFQLFTNIFIDIGDNQSIESDLSTYSSHLRAAKHIVNFSNADTMVLMDEIGTGTDPMFGGPMAEAVLEEIAKKGVYGVVTTHFSNIKTKAEKLEGTVNAAMLFDVENLVPLYKLNVGQPGSSFVYEVAANIGLNKKLIKRAKQLTHTKQYDLDILLAEVQSKQEQLIADQEELTKKLEQAKLVESEYFKLKNDISNQQKEIIQQANDQANRLIKDANKNIEKAIREIQEAKADKQKTKKVRATLATQMTPHKEEKPAEIKTNFKVGDSAQIVNTTSVGEIVEIKRNKAFLQIGSITTSTKLENLQKVGSQTAKKVKKYISTVSYNEKQMSFKSDKDIRGMRTADALIELDSWIDNALILGVGKLRVLHGKGNGILKMELRRHLKGHPSIHKIGYEHIDLGGEGISIIELK